MPEVHIESFRQSLRPRLQLLRKVRLVVRVVIKADARPPTVRILCLAKLRVAFPESLELLLMADLALAVAEALEVRLRTMMFLVARRTGDVSGNFLPHQ